MSISGIAIRKFQRYRPLLRRFQRGLGCSRSAGLLVDDDNVESLKPLSFVSFRYYCRSVVEQFSDDEYECEFETHTACSSVANIDEWKWKLSLLLHNKEEMEMVSKDEKDRRDYEQIASVARRMGLFSERYGKVVVASKVPLPTYRPDLDDRRPQREVAIPLGLQRRVESLLQEYLDRNQMNGSGLLGGCSADERGSESVNLNEDSVLEQTEAQTLDRTVLEKILQRQSWRVRNLQHSWQV